MSETTSKQVGEHTYYEKVGDLDESSSEEPGYSDSNDGCKKKTEDLMSVLLVAILTGALLIAHLVRG